MASSSARTVASQVGSAWLTVSRDTLDELMRFKTRHALPTWDATLRALLAQAGRADGPADDPGDER